MRARSGIWCVASAGGMSAVEWWMGTQTTLTTGLAWLCMHWLGPSSGAATGIAHVCAAKVMLSVEIHWGFGTKTMDAKPAVGTLAICRVYRLCTG